MTPEEEKAKELFDKMNGFRITHAHRIKCAKIVCDEAMIALRWDEVTNLDNFWPDVKIALDKLQKPKKIKPSKEK